MSSNTNVMVVSGLLVKSASLSSKNNQIKLVLESDKDDITCNIGTIANALVSLEFHSTGADSSPVSVGLNRNSFEFNLENFKVTQDKLVVVLATPEDEEGGDDDAANVNALILSAVAAHAANGTPVELTLAAANDVSGA